MPFLKSVLKQYDLVAGELELPGNVMERLRYPKRSLLVSIPIEMDSGAIKVYKGYRVQHDITLGPSKGGIRYHPNVNLEEVTALAMLEWPVRIIGDAYFTPRVRKPGRSGRDVRQTQCAGSGQRAG